MTTFPFELDGPGQIDALARKTTNANATPADCPLTWDAEGFARRDDSDHVSVTQTTRLRPLALSTPLFADPLANDRRARYDRYALIATSRYAGLAPVTTVTSGHMADVTQLTYQFTDRWRRLLIPCRWTEAPPKPLLKIVFPLTQAASAGGSPGLIAVLSEPWFQIVGINERLRAEVELIGVKKKPVPPPTTLPTYNYYPQFGADPILDGAEWPPDVDIATVTPSFSIVGPAGPSFDGSMYTNSWFFIEPIATPGGPQGPFDWRFAKICLRRSLAAEAFPLQPASGDLALVSAFDAACNSLDVTAGGIFAVLRAAVPHRSFN